jgi:tRNA threonylcarbamoyl adenosine modification protein YjeE
MMDEQVILPDMTGAYEVALPDEAATRALGHELAGLVQPGDLIALWGDLGMGKSVLARALIQEAQRLAGGEAEDVPSPTFTLVQTYEAGGLSLAHFDLYRIGASEEIYELGLDEALETGAALIEWPGRAPQGPGAAHRGGARCAWRKTTRRRKIRNGRGAGKEDCGFPGESRLGYGRARAAGVRCLDPRL